MENSSIEWTDHTFNPWTGCTKVSPGCANCYAEGWAKRSGIVEWGPGKPRRRTTAAAWKEPVKWNREADEFAQCHCGFRGVIPFISGRCPECQNTNIRYRRPRVFCASLADVFDEEVPGEWREDLLALIDATPHLYWLLLTKRPENIERLMQAAMRGNFEPDRTFAVHLPNVWLGTTVEDQQRADERIPALLKIRARVRFLSCEPMVGPVEFSNVTRRADCVSMLGKPALDGIDWVICGGESGQGARPMHLDWARSVRDQCAAVRVPFLFKQWGEWLPNCQNEYVKAPEKVAGPLRVGKKAAGRVLDGRTWDEFPK